MVKTNYKLLKAILVLEVQKLDYYTTFLLDKFSLFDNFLNLNIFPDFDNFLNLLVSFSILSLLNPIILLLLLFYLKTNILDNLVVLVLK